MAPIGGDDRVRRCSECSEKVFLVESEEELNQRTAAKQCIALAESVATKLLAQLPEEYDTAKNGDMLSGECLPLHPGPRRR